MTTENTNSGESMNRAGRKSLPSLRFRLLLYVNSVMAVAVMLFLVLDYRREYHSRLQEQRIFLTEEAKSLLPALQRLRHHGSEEIQSYLDEVCASMREDQSPGHHIAARIDGVFLQAMHHRRASPEMLTAMERASDANDPLAKLGDRTLLIGCARQQANVVFVSENLDNLHYAIMGQTLWRLAGMGLLAFLAAAVVNVVLLRFVAAPIESLAKTVEQVSRGDLGVQTSSQATAELAYLADAINSMSSSLEKSEGERNAQIAKARRIQENLIPKLANVDHLTVAHLFQPAADIAGDFFDVLQMSDGTWLFCIADVTGHGIAAAMGAMVLKTLFVEASEKHEKPKAILAYINRWFVAVTLPDDFASMFVGRWDPRTSRLEYASAGHEPGYLLKPKGTLKELRATGLLLGIQEDVEWEPAVIPLTNGDQLFLVTDGVVETFRADNTVFGRQNLVNLLRTGENASLKSKVEKLEQTLIDFRGGQPSHDDVTLVAIEFTECADEFSGNANAPFQAE